MNIKDIARNVLNVFHIDLTQNLKYDRYTKAIISRVVKEDSNCVDVGCHKGEILDLMLKRATQGKCIGIEPIPSFYQKLLKKYSGRAIIYPYALGAYEGKTLFNFVKDSPAYSGIKKRKYSMENPEIEEIEVELKTLDSLIEPSLRIDFMKIDVEGGEFDVIKGAKRILTAHKPTVVFECGLGASEFYGTSPSNLYDYITLEVGLSISTLESFVKNQFPLTKNQFITCFETNTEYYFVAHKQRV